MEITDVRIRLIENEPRLKAVAAITIDNAFVVHDIKIIEGDKGIFIVMPSVKTKDGSYRDIAHPINQDARTMIQNEILKKYNEALSAPQQ